MRAIILTSMMFVGMTLAFNKEAKAIIPDKVVVNSFNSMYPNASRPEWEKKKGYFVVEFHEKGVEKEAWFENTGKWVFTESDLTYKKLPKIVKASFTKSEYKDWRVEDVKLVERIDIEDVYIIEIEKGNQEYDLYYTPEGSLIKAINDNNKREPSIINTSIKEFITERYPNSVILDIEQKAGYIKVEILHERKEKEVLFDLKNAWISTSWDIQKFNLPENVMTTYKTSDYRNYRIDDIVYIEYANGNMQYIFELEYNNKDFYFTIDHEGNIVK